MIMESFKFLLVISIILLSTKALGTMSEKVHMPQVVGALLAGIILGPSVLGIITQTSYIHQTAEIGVILLMFLAGLDTDLDELKQNGLASILIAILGVLLPLIGGTIVFCKFYPIEHGDYQSFLKALFIGVVLTATSVSITVETLREMGKLKGRMGTTILGAAIIDDIIGIIMLTIISSVSDPTVKPSVVFLKIILFFIFIALVGFIVHSMKKSIEQHKNERRTSIYSLTFCLILAYISERFFGIADITGAYFAGIILCNFLLRNYVAKKINILSYLFFSPIFFASIGLKTSLDGLNMQLLTFAIVLLIVAILTKIIGCGIGAKICKFDNLSALSIGIGMVSRGEVALIIAQKGESLGMIDPKLFPAIVIVVIVTTLITPILLKIVLSNKKLNN